MNDRSAARLALPLLAAGQAQKEWTHNEALALLDLAVQATVAGDARRAARGPGGGRSAGSSAMRPTGAWTGHAGAIAGWTAGGWRFVAPREGMAAVEPYARFARPACAGPRRGAGRLDRDGAQVVGPRGRRSRSGGGSRRMRGARAIVGDPGGAARARADRPPESCGVAATVQLAFVRLRGNHPFGSEFALSVVTTEKGDYDAEACRHSGTCVHRAQHARPRPRRCVVCGCRRRRDDRRRHRFRHRNHGATQVPSITIMATTSMASIGYDFGGFRLESRSRLSHARRSTAIARR